MKVLHHFPHLRLAQAFSDYLTKLSIINTIEKNEFDYQIIIIHATQFPLAETELALFLANPNDAKYLSASWESGKVDKSSGSIFSANSDIIGNFKQHGGILTHSLLLVCIVVYFIFMLGLFPSLTNALFFFDSQPFDFLQSWRFITPAFLHFSFLHIAFNLLWWWQLGGLIESQQGKQRLILLFLFSAITSNFAQFLLVGPNFGGLSGVVYGLVGYCWLYGNLNKQSKVQLPNNLFLFLIGWLVLGFVDILPANIANYAHLVGLLAGLLLAAVSNKLK